MLTELRYLGILLLLAGLLLAGCQKPPESKKAVTALKGKIADTGGKKISDCTGCHAVDLDQNHNFSCSACHGGSKNAGTMEEAHSSLVSRPASPANMAVVCGKCHAALVEHVQDSDHFTLKNEINMVRQAFGATEALDGPEMIPQTISPETPLQLADDLLRRRCLRCHVYDRGDRYPAVEHGTGCAACHLRYDNGKLNSHRFVARPDDKICLSCHHGNRVGTDYYGLFEHDYHWDYQTPYLVNQSEEPPYGVNYHELRPDVHQSAGIACIDCHSGNQIMGVVSRKTSCRSCHAAPDEPETADRLMQLSRKNSESEPVMTTKLSAIELTVPQMQAEHHQDSNKSCQVCHAQWSFADFGTHLLRSDDGEYFPWLRLTGQGSYEIEQLLEHNLFSEDDELPPTMTDKFTGATKFGIWLKGFELRRWEEIPVCLDDQGVWQVCRPILDLHISYVDEDSEVVIDAAPAKAANNGMQPYAPHTIGKAGAFRNIKTYPIKTK